MAVTEAVRLENLSFSWDAGAPVLSISNFSLNKGESVFIQGASGSGKSTLLGLIGGVLKPDSGSVSVLEQNLVGLSSARRDAFRADHIGFIFQLFNLIPYLSVLANVTLPCRFSKSRQSAALGAGTSEDEEAKRLLDRLGLSSSIQLREVSRLSIGQQQRVAAARALIGKPEIVIADEPTSALDADAREDFIELLMSECKAAGAAVLFVSHDRSLASRFDRSVSMEALNGQAANT